MATPEFQALQAALGKPNTPDARRQAGQALSAYLRAHPDTYNPIITSMGVNKDYPTQIPLTVLPAVLEKNPAYFDHLKEFITRYSG